MYGDNPLKDSNLTSNTRFVISGKSIALLLVPVILMVSLIGVTYIQKRPSNMDIQPTGLDGEILPTKAFEGKIQIVEFMTTWCKICKQVTQNVDYVLRTNYSADVVFWSVSIDVTHDLPEVMKNYLKDNNIADHVQDDHWQFARDLKNEYVYFGVSGVPHTFLLDREMRIVRDKIGLLVVEEILSWIELARQADAR